MGTFHAIDSCFVITSHGYDHEKVPVPYACDSAPVITGDQ